MVSYFLSEDKRSPMAGGYAIAVGDFVTGGERSHFRQLKKRDERPIILKRLPCAIALHPKAPPTGHRRFFNRFGSQADFM